MKTPEVDHVPDIVLEQYALGELDGERSEAIRRRMVTDAALAARMEALLRSNEEVLRDDPPEAFAVAVRSKATAGHDVPIRLRPQQGWTGRRRLWWVAGPALAAGLAALLLVLAPPPARNTGMPQDAGVRIKGLEPHISVYRKSGADVARLADGASAASGDLLQISYLAADASHGVIVSLDGAGVVTLHHPEAGASTRLEATGEIPIPHAYRLDDAPDFERFFFVYSASPIRTADVEAAVRRLAGDRDNANRLPLVLPDGLEQYSITLEKEPRS